MALLSGNRRWEAPPYVRFLLLFLVWESLNPYQGAYQLKLIMVATTQLELI